MILMGLNGNIMVYKWQYFNDININGIKWEYLGGYGDINHELVELPLQCYT